MIIFGFRVEFLENSGWGTMTENGTWRGMVADVKHQVTTDFCKPSKPIENYIKYEISGGEIYLCVTSPYNRYKSESC